MAGKDCDASDNCRKREQGANAACIQRTRVLCFFRAWNFFGSCGLPTPFFVKTDNANAYTMFHIAGAKVVQKRSPVFVFA